MALFAIGCLCLLGCCCVGAIVCWDGYYLPFKYCRPVAYPSSDMTGLVEGKWFTHTTTNDINEVISFYDARLLTGQHQLGNIELGEWRKEHLKDERLLYHCAGTDINLLSTETGCVYISKKDQDTYIESWFFRSEGTHIPCPK